MDTTTRTSAAELVLISKARPRTMSATTGSASIGGVTRIGTEDLTVELRLDGGAALNSGTATISDAPLDESIHSRLDICVCS